MKLKEFDKTYVVTWNGSEVIVRAKSPVYAIEKARLLLPSLVSLSGLHIVQQGDTLQHIL
jgi:hypothetical protein